MRKQSVALAGLVSVLIAAPASPADAAVQTTSGLVQGTTTADGAIRVYTGIPFAAAPMSELRWQAPKPAAPRQGVRDAREFGARCVQGQVFSDIVFTNKRTARSWQPRPDSSRPTPSPGSSWRNCSPGSILASALTAASRSLPTRATRSCRTSQAEEPPPPVRELLRVAGEDDGRLRARHGRPGRARQEWSTPRAHTRPPRRRSGRERWTHGSPLRQRFRHDRRRHRPAHGVGGSQGQRLTPRRGRLARRLVPLLVGRSRG